LSIRKAFNTATLAGLPVIYSGDPVQASPIVYSDTGDEIDYVQRGSQRTDNGEITCGKAVTPEVLNAPMSGLLSAQ
jgi:hypothetical protein